MATDREYTSSSGCVFYDLRIPCRDPGCRICPADDETARMLYAFLTYLRTKGYEVCELDGTGYASTVSDATVDSLVMDFAGRIAPAVVAAPATPDNEAPTT